LEILTIYDISGVRIVAIGNGTPAMAKNFKSEFNFPGKLYVDQLRKIYKLLNLRRGMNFNV
jgi:peroxiredoxin